MIAVCSLQANHNPEELIEVRYIGTDVGKRRCQACVMDENGGIVDEFVFDDAIEGMQELLDRACYTECKAVLGSTGNLWLRIYEALEDRNIDVKLANPKRLPLNIV